MEIVKSYKGFNKDMTCCPGSRPFQYEEGAEYMNGQLDLLRETMPAGFGIAVHHIRSWRELTERTD